MRKESIPKFQFLKDKFLHSAKERVARRIEYHRIGILSTSTEWLFLTCLVFDLFLAPGRKFSSVRLSILKEMSVSSKVYLEPPLD